MVSRKKVSIISKYCEIYEKRTNNYHHQAALLIKNRHIPSNEQMFISKDFMRERIFLYFCTPVDDAKFLYSIIAVSLEQGKIPQVPSKEGWVHINIDFRGIAQSG